MSKLTSYIKLVDFLADMLGEDSEVVLHDVSIPENSIIAIRNNYISERKIGGPVTDLVLKEIKDVEKQKKDYICNYKGYTYDGNVLKSSSFFIRDEKGKIIGVLCINTNCKKIIDTINYLKNLLVFNENTSSKENERVSENLNLSVEELLNENIKKIVLDTGIIPKRMSQSEKMEVVKKINSEGLFLLKGSVSQTAMLLNISEPSVYRYLNLIKKEEERK